jgi:hypothetical protein
MSDADHEVIESPEALFRHLYEEHGVEEAHDLDPETAPLQFWIRRHADLERAERAARQPDPPSEPPEPPEEAEPEQRPAAQAQWPSGWGRPAAEQSRTEVRGWAEARGRTEPRGRAEERGDAARSQPRSGGGQPPPGGGQPRPGGGPGREGRRHAPFGDPLVEAMARALAGRGHDEGAVRSAIRSFGAGGSGPSGVAAVRAALVEPMLQSAAERLLGAPSMAGAPSPAGTARATGAARAGGATEAAGPLPPPGRPQPPQREEAAPEAVWAGIWADLADTGRRPAQRAPAGGDDGDDLMAVANAVQARRRVRRRRR